MEIILTIIVLVVIICVLFIVWIIYQANKSNIHLLTDIDFDVLEDEVFKFDTKYITGVAIATPGGNSLTMSVDRSKEVVEYENRAGDYYAEELERCYYASHMGLIDEEE